jgi:hypothetical protein
MDFGFCGTPGWNANFIIMIQDIIVTILIIAALSNIAYHFVKLITRRNIKHACGGCSECEIKKSIVQKKFLPE